MFERRQLVLLASLLLTLVLLVAQGASAQQCTANGNANCLGDEPTINDLTVIMGFFDRSEPLPPCWEQMDVNGDCVIDRWDYRTLIECIAWPHPPCPTVLTCCEPVVNYSCCVGTVGDVNGWGWDNPTISDVSSMVDMVFITGLEVDCLSEADMNQSGGSNPQPDDITVADLSILIDYLFVTGSSLELVNCLQQLSPSD